jgi:hypothetical protein
MKPLVVAVPRRPIEASDGHADVDPALRIAAE